MDPAVKAVSGFIAIAFAGVLLIMALTGGMDRDTDTPVRVSVPAGARSLYIYRGAAPELSSNWHHCYALNGEAGTRTPILLAGPGQRHWNFLAYAEPDCPVNGGAEPFAAARNVTAPADLFAWSVVLR